jgi:hypothetical protein
MKRLAIIVMALLACAACLGMAQVIVGQVGPWLMVHPLPRWFVPACNVFVFGCLGIAGLRRKKAAAQEDERLTPLVRRDPRTGLRQL